MDSGEEAVYRPVTYPVVLLAWPFRHILGLSPLFPGCSVTLLCPGLGLLPSPRSLYDQHPSPLELYLRKVGPLTPGVSPASHPEVSQHLHFLLLLVVVE